MWREENNKETSVEPEGSDLRSIGVSVGDIESDEATGEEMAAPESEPGMGPEVIAPVTTQAPGAAPAGASGGGTGM